MNFILIDIKNAFDPIEAEELDKEILEMKLSNTEYIAVSNSNS